MDVLEPIETSTQQYIDYIRFLREHIARAIGLLDDCPARELLTVLEQRPIP